MDDIFPKRIGQNQAAVSGAQPTFHAGRWLSGILILTLILAASASWYLIGQYNAMQRNDERADAEWSNLLSQYTRRADLIPNLVSVVGSYASHESKLFNEITAARAGILNLPTSVESGRDSRSLEQFQQAQNKLAAPLSRLLVVAENYPDLKASELFRDLMVQLEGTENRIAYARQRYIVAVAEYNFGIRRFPNNMIAGQAGFKRRARLSVENESAISRIPKIDLK